MRRAVGASLVVTLILLVALPLCIRYGPASETALGAVTAPLVAAKIGDTTTALIAAFAYVGAALIPLRSVLAERHAAREPERQRA